MGMLDRIKKRQLEGFKEFVQNMETTSALSRQQIFMTGILEDPLFMGHVTKNMKGLEDFMKLPSEEIDRVLGQQEQMLGIFAKAMTGRPTEQVMELEKVIPRHFGKIRDELSYLKEVSIGEKESAVFFLIKAVRKLQDKEEIQGFGWRLPPMDIFYPKTYPEGLCEIIFESGITAAHGEMQRGKRKGPWRHFYDTGRLLAEGEYLDGLKSGQWTVFFTNGSMKAQGKYLVDLKQGPWKEWDRLGNLSELEYKDGVRVDQSSSN